MKKAFSKHFLRLLVVAVFVCGLFWTTSVQAVTIVEYLTPTPNSSPADLAFDDKGHLWFTEINTNKIGRLDPFTAKPGTSEGIVEYDLPQKNSKPSYIIVAKDGIVWFSEMAGRIGRLDPATGKIKEYDVPTPKSEPHHLAEAADGSIWFLEFEGNKIARLKPASESIEEFPVGEGHPHDLVLDGENIWYTKGGKFWAQEFFNKIGWFDIKTREVSEVSVPPKKSVPHGMALAGDGGVWFSQLFAGKITRLDTAKSPPALIEYEIPGKRRGPHDLIVDSKRGWVWFVDNRGDNIGRLDLSKAKPGTTEGMEMFKIPTPKAHPSELVLDKEGNVWFTEMGHYFRGRFQSKIGKLVP